MKRTSPEFIGVQTLALKVSTCRILIHCQNFSSMFQDLGLIFDIKELSGIASRFIESVQYGENLKLMNMEKLQLIHKLVCSELFLQQGIRCVCGEHSLVLDARSVLMPTILQQIRKHITSSTQDEVVQSTKILSVILDLIQTKLQSQQETMKELLVLIPELITAIHGLRISAIPGSDARLDVIACLLSLFHLLKPDHFVNYIADMKDDSARIVRDSH